MSPETATDRPQAPPASRLLRALAALACSACMVLGSPDHDHWWLGFIGWLPWLWVIDRSTPRAAFWYGWLTGTVTVFWGFIWITELLTRFADFGQLATLGVHLLFAAFQGLQWALPAWAIARIKARTGRDLLWIAPLAWTAGEALLPQVFPSYLALMWAWQPLWLQVAEIGGVTAVGFVMLLINSGLYVALREWISARRLDRPALILFLATLIGVPLYGAIRIAQIDALIERSPKVKFGVVQGNFGITQWGHGTYKRVILRAQQEMSAKLERDGAELILWGETAYPFSRAIGRRDAADLPLSSPRRVRRDFTVPLIFGLVTADRGAGGSPYPWNSAIVLNPDGTVGDLYDKNYPLVFGEYIPIVDPGWYLEMVPAASYINPGKEPKALRALDYRFGPLICYEDILPRFARDIANQRIHAFVNLTNDSWFGKTKEQHQHLGLGVIRTIENRRPMVRAVNAGISAYIDPVGRLVHATEVTDPDNDGLQPADGFIADVPMIDPEVRTLYSYFGESFNSLCLLALAVLGLRRRRQAA
ncbi:MAG: apolipoprotein N-acyltransferase [Nannocystis sp.]|nr:apolipoprotein N-acyltransferase [Nannocystis sp.]